MTVVKAFGFGIVHSITQFLPISASGHQVLIPWFFGGSETSAEFRLLASLGAVAALFIYFFSDWLRLLRAGFLSVFERRIGFEVDRHQFWFLVIATLPICVVQFFLGDVLEAMFHAPLLIAIFLCLGGFLLYWADGRCTSLRAIEDMRVRDSVWFGIVHIFGLIPGVSRVGAMSTIGRFLGLSRPAVTRFSYMLLFPALADVIVLNAGTLVGGHGLTQSLPLCLATFLGAFLATLVTIHGMLQFIRAMDFSVFAWYRMLLAAVVVAWSLVFGA